MRICLLITVLGAVLTWAVPLAADPPAPGVRERGKVLYEKHCAYCHGLDGRADTPVGRLLKPRPRNFADPVEMARVTRDRIYRAIRDGRQGTAMPAWEGVLGETQMGDMTDYIQSLVPPLPRTLSAGELSLEIGRRIYERECAICHGTDGRADTKAAKILIPRPRNLADPIEMGRVDDGRMYAAIKLGRPGTGMAGWGELLSPVEIIDLMRYIRSLVQPLPGAMTRAKLDLAVAGKIFEQHCVTCHGEKGDGQTPLGRSLVPPARNLKLTQLTDREMAQVIARGRAGTAMAPWGGILNSEDIRRVIFFIRQTVQRAP